MADPHPLKKIREVKEFCNKIGKTLRLLEHETQWANRAELYVGLLKEAVRKDKKTAGSPLVFLGLRCRASSYDSISHGERHFSASGEQPIYRKFWRRRRNF